MAKRGRKSSTSRIVEAGGEAAGTGRARGKTEWGEVEVKWHRGPSRRRPQQTCGLAIIRKLYPDGVPREATTELVRGQINRELAADPGNRNLADLSWDTVNRLLGRS